MRYDMKTLILTLVILIGIDFMIIKFSSMIDPYDTEDDDTEHLFI